MTDIMQPGQSIGGGAKIKEAVKTVITPEFLVSYPFIHRRGRPMGDDKIGKYSISCLFPVGCNLQNLVDEVMRAAREEYGADKTNWPKLKNPFRDQGDKDGSQGYVKGALYIIPTAKNQPGLVDQNVQKIIDESKFYAGCYAIAEVRAYCYDYNGVKGIAFGLNNVQKTREGTPISGRMAPEEVFSPITPAAGAEHGALPISAADLFA